MVSQPNAPDLCLGLAALHLGYANARAGAADALEQYIAESDAHLVAVASDYQYLSSFFDKTRPAPAIAYGVSTSRQVHSLVRVDEIDSPAGWASMRLTPVSGGGDALAIATAFQLGLSYTFLVASIEVILVSLPSAPSLAGKEPGCLEGRVVARIRGRFRGPGGLHDEVVVRVSRSDMAQLRKGSPDD